MNDEAVPTPPATGGAVADTSTSASLWQHRAFVQLWISSVSTSFGFQMVSVAIGWQVYAITGRALDLGLIGLVQFVPSLLLALPAGHIADRYERRRVVLIAQVVVLFAIALLAVLTATDRIPELGIFAILFIIGIAMAFEWPAQRSMLPSLVPAAILPRAMAMNSSGDQAASIVGPALGGLLYIAGPQIVYAVAALLYLVSVITMSRLPYRQVESKRESATWKSVFAGVHFIRRNPDMLGVISLDLFAVLLGGATALLPIFARDILHTGPLGLGMLRGAPAVGALLMSLWLARRAIERKVGMTMFAAVAGFGLATLVFAWSTAMWLSLIALFALGAFDMVSVVIRSALVQLDTPDDMRGRVNSVNAVFVNTSNQLGEFESGMLAAWIGAVPAVLVGGVGTLLIVGLWMAIFPTLRRRQRMQSDALRSACDPAYDPN